MWHAVIETSHRCNYSHTHKERMLPLTKYNTKAKACHTHPQPHTLKHKTHTNFLLLWTEWYMQTLKALNNTVKVTNQCVCESGCVFPFPFSIPIFAAQLAPQTPKLAPSSLQAQILCNMTTRSTNVPRFPSLILGHQTNWRQVHMQEMKEAAKHEGIRYNI